MMGNVWEWNETLISGYRGFRGGAYLSDDGGPGYYLRSSGRGYNIPYYEISDLGFRVASVPEPCSLALLLIGGLVLRRKCS